MGVLAMIPLPLLCDPSPLSKGRGVQRPAEVSSQSLARDQ